MSSRTRFPFTASQWQELEQQALIFKYMASGIPIPADLLFNVRRSYLDSPLSARFLPQHVGWNCLQMSIDRKIDPEPGRCRRTDGKKWRCSKEAYPDCKYCERHMHRGKNRSRKPVEVLKTTHRITNKNPSPSAALLTPTTHAVSHSQLPSSSLSSETHHRPHHPCYTSSASPHAHLHFQSNCNAPYRPPGNTSALSFQDSNNTPLFVNTGAPYSDNNNTDYRNKYVYGLKEEVAEHAFFSEPSGTIRNLSASSVDDCFTPLTMSSSSSKQRGCSGLQEYSHLELQSSRDNGKQQDRDQRNCYGIDDEIPMRLGNNEQPQRTMHRFFDEWPHKGRDSWLDLDDKTSNSSSVSTTGLSISIPTTHEFSSLT